MMALDKKSKIINVIGIYSSFKDLEYLKKMS